MQSKIIRRIGFYNLRVLLKSDGSPFLQPQQYIQSILGHIMQKPKENRRRELGDDRFYFLSDCRNLSAYPPDTQPLVFKFADYGRLPPLIERTTLQERQNTRVITEGELQRTHAVIRYFDDEAVVLLEVSRPAITISRLSQYLKIFDQSLHTLKGIKQLHRIEDGIIPKGDFLEELHKLKRAQVGTITVSNQLMGSDYLNLSDQLSEIQKDINLTVKAERKKDIGSLVEDLFNNMSAEERKVKRLRVYGTDEQNQAVKLDTKRIRREEYLEFTPDPITKQVKTSEILERLSRMIGEF